ncbi:Slp family lipoprotein [Psychrosphaera sp.]|nr:Slp family lipoprotein [Psychrosphaera sp.]
MNFFRKLIASVSIVIISGCASYPETVSVPENTNLVPFSSINADDNSLIGEQARWSGVIAEVKNESNRTRLDVLYYPARGTGRPDLKEDPQGRFRVYADGFLDPQVFKKGKSVTALGEIKDSESQKIDEFEYLYPTITKAKIHLWKKLDPPTRVEFHYGWYGHYPHWRWQGGTRHRYIIGGSTKKITPSGVVKSKDKKQ